MQGQAHMTLPPPFKVLIVDRDRPFRTALESGLRQAGCDVVTAAPADVVVADVNAAGLAAVLAGSRSAAVLVVASHGSAADATAAIRGGAADYLVKPVPVDVVVAAVHRLKPPPSPADVVVGTDPQMVRIFDLVDAVADSRTTVLITGESGTGKSVLARAVHARSPRRDGPFVEVSCGALPESLLESELFGHVRGAFTGATGDKPGRFLAADGGTLFLDEINSATPALQVKLLRVLQERAFEPVGSSTTRTVDVRVVLASNVDLAALVADGRFRQDLYYRVNVIAVRLPPLRDRPGDVRLLADRFLLKYRAESNRPAAGLTAAAVAALTAYPWPGNVRELENAIERAVVLCRRPLVDVDDLPDAVRHVDVAPVTLPTADVLTYVGPPLPLAAALERPERQIIEAALRRNNGNRQRTADQLGINRTTLYKKMLRYSIGP